MSSFRAALQESARHNIEVVLRGLQASSDAADAPSNGAANGSAINTREQDKQIDGKNAVVSKALAGGADATPALLDASTEVVRMLKQKWDAAQGLNGMVRAYFGQACCALSDCQRHCDKTCPRDGYISAAPIADDCARVHANARPLAGRR